ncbi:MAG: DUF4013 domain-containing protein [Methanobrevibacter thaueri]|jgi:hypothetical protein|uniref:DUF4013 domain-containing protein n=1 Tax=Methanobrevibacter thaueri TaxID=190975 RepID=UPI0026EBBC22|nr:DUF4013 domain-containing protein [Methanobrevibacter thaueri]MBE6495361.1 DUF4013 domain-containing protein [Methanobrevibacter thaueri]
MELTEIMSDALLYPFQNIKALVLYLILGIILGISIAGLVVALAASYAAENVLAILGTGVLGVIIALILSFIISGYQLDIVKFGINRDPGAPGIDIIRQFVNGFKLFIVQIVYYLIPIIIGAILAIFFQNWLSSIINFIIAIIFGLAAIMGQCRLAKSEDMAHALAIGDAIGDISRVGIVKLLVFIILMMIIAVILATIMIFVARWNNIIGGILIGILGVYFSFFVSRATGLLYSNV